MCLGKNAGKSVWNSTLETIKLIKEDLNNLIGTQFYKENLYFFQNLYIVLP